MNRIITLLILFAFSHFKLLPQSNDGPAVIQSPDIPRCGFDEINGQLSTQLERERRKHLNEILPRLSSLDKSLSAPLLTISVVVHIIHNGEPVGQGQNLSDARIQAQIAILNQDFTALNPQFDNTPDRWKSIAGTPNIQFCLASVAPDGSPSNGIARHNMLVTGTSWNNNNINSVIKPAIRWDPSRYFNIYVVPIPETTALGGVVGYSNYPVPGLIGADQDGVVIDYRWFGAPGYGASGWRALTHETGHYLGLPHPFNGNSCFTDDGIADTPEIEKSTREYATLDCSGSYPAGPISCGNEHLYINYMDYVAENCYTSFTDGQVNVMRAVLDGTSQGFGYGSRHSLITNAANQCTLPAYDAGVTKIISPNPSDCITGSITPQITFRNFGVVPLNSVQIITQINAATVATLNWSGNLAPGENKDLILPAINPPNGNFTLKILTSNPNLYPDGNSSNDSVTKALSANLSFAPPMSEDFENENAFPTSDGMFEFNVSNDVFKWQLTNLASGFGQGNKCAMFDNFAGTQNSNPFGTLDAMITKHFDFSGLAAAQLRFDLAYAPFNSSVTDTLMVMVATDCSQAFTQLLYKKGGVNLATATATTQAFIPTAAQWRTETLDLSAFAGKKSVRIAFLNVSGWGNRLYIDNIQVGASCSGLSAQLNTAGTGCASCNGQAQVLASGGSGNYTYQWAGSAQTASSISGLCAGPVNVTVTDVLGCSVEKSGTIVLTSGPSASVSKTNETSFGAKNGTASVTASGGVPPYTYQWSNGSSGTAVSGLNPGNYWVKVKDSQLCETIVNFSIAAFDCGSFSVSTQAVNVTCFGGSNGSLMAVPNGGTGPFTYNWSNGVQVQNNTGLQTGTYTVTATDFNHCPAIKSTSITQPAPITININATHETANNAHNGTATASVSGGTPGYGYNWSNGSVSQTINNLSPGFYSLTITDQAGCTKTASVTINSFSCGGFQASLSTSDVSCFGLQNGNASVSTSGGNLPVSYLWSNGQTSQSIGNLSPGNYSVTVTDASACSTQLNATIGQPALLSVNATATAVSSADANDGTATANPTGGTPAYQYQWSTGSTSNSIQQLSSGNYSVTVTDQHNCTAVQTVTVGGIVCNLSITTAVFPTTCPNVGFGSAEVSEVLGASGTVSYQWSNGSNSFFINNLLAGEYSVTVSDGSGCSVTKTMQVTSTDVQAPTLVTKNVTLQLNNNGTAILNPEAVGEGSFDNCSLVYISATPTEFNCSQIGQNTVIVTATDAAGNTSHGSAVVTVVDGTPPLIVCPQDITTSLCSGVQYVIPTAADNCGIPSVSLVSGLPSGSAFPVGTSLVTWKATGQNGMTANCTFKVTLANDLAISITNTSHATNGQANGSIEFQIAGGSSPYSLVWKQNGSVIENFDPGHIPPGAYQLTVTDNNGCITTSPVIVIENLTALNETETDKLVQVFPNPTTGLVQLQFDPALKSIADIRIFDVNGKLIADKRQWGSQKIVIDLGSEAPGVYLLKISLNEFSFTKRIVKL